MKKKYSFLLLLLFLTISVVAILKLWPATEAAPRSATTITIKFSPGDKTGAFEEKEYELVANSKNNYITIPDDFAKTINMIEESYYKKVDDETFYFDKDDYSYSFTGWKVNNASILTPSETVFQPGDSVSIDTLLAFDTDKDGIIELDALWGKVLYVQNPYSTMYYTDYWIIDYDKTKTYDKTGSWNYKYENNVLTLNDGKNKENPLCSLDYAYYLLYQEDVTNNFSNANSKNSYENVLMLTGDLNYVKSSDNGSKQANYFKAYDLYDGSTFDETKNYIFGDHIAQQRSFGYVSYYTKSGVLSTKDVGSNNTYAPSVTFKSYNNNQFNLYINGHGYYDFTYNSIRVDNVYYRAITNNFKPNQSSPVTVGSETAFSGSNKSYLEFTKRANARGFSVLRTNTVQTVVLNGGTFPSWQTSWSTSQESKKYNYELHWYMGQNATVTGPITLGTTAPYENSKPIISQDFKFVITGGTVKDIFGGSYGINSKSIGKREITVIGDGTNNIATNPKITNIYGAAKSGTFTGDAYVNISGATNVTNVYGGGCDFTATTYGNTHVNIKNSTINGNVYGGGYNGNVKKDDSQNGGNVEVSIQNSKVLGNIFGSGTGGTQIIEIPITMSKSQDECDWQNTQYIPTNSDFTSIKNKNNGDYDTDWTWSNPAEGFPFLQKDTEYICISAYKGITWISNNPNYITFARYYSYTYLSLAMVENDVNITIDESTVGTKDSSTNGNVYGGGSLATVEGNTYVTVKNNSTIYGSVYGGGDGITKPTSVRMYYPQNKSTYVAPKYTVVKDSKGNITNVQVENEASKYGNYAYSTKFEWSDDTSLKDTNGVDIDKHLIYSPNVDNVGIIKQNTNVTVQDSNITGNVLAGGNAADVLGKTQLIITNSKISDVYGGGYSGNVNGDTEVNINSGTVENVFGGGNLGTVKGNTVVDVGDEKNSNLSITQLLYGGGRGYDADNDGDASDFVTVYGTATVKIQGMNTHVENYGSITLGSVQKTINVTFKNYWTGNSTAKYKTMNGIDRATNVYFENSYVLLTNKDSNGNLLGIKTIENLYIPDESGLKISAPGEISGNFEGGGELYLDSEVCLNIRGNITGTTTLVLNPLMYENEAYKIKGGEDNPYLKVYGTTPELIERNEAIALVSGDTDYTITYKQIDDFVQYYIANDITIDKNLTEKIILQEGKKINANTDDWNSNTVQIMQDGVISANFQADYQFKKDENLGNKYQNIERSIIIESGEGQIPIPVGTKVMLITTDGEIYRYKLTENQDVVKLKDFVNIQNNNQNYAEVSNVADASSGNAVTLMYTYSEQFRIVLDFSECENCLETNKTYNILMKIQDTVESIKAPEYIATNIMNIQQKRNVTYDASLEKKQYTQNGNIRLNGTINMNALIDNSLIDTDTNKDLVIKIKLKNENGGNINIPDGTAVTVNDVQQTMNMNYVLTNLGQITKDSLNQKLNIDLDMTGVTQENYKLEAGNYKLVVEAYTQENDMLQRLMMSNEYDFGIIKKHTFGLDAKITNDAENQDKLQLFDKNSKDKVLEINVDKGELANPYVKIKLQKRTSMFTYTDTENTVVSSIIENKNLQENNKLSIKNKLSTGMYRLVINLYDEHNNNYTEKTVNFIVK